ncbi:MAG: hypothetical protein U0136_21045 [Bdellovibrionota bacterium]
MKRDLKLGVFTEGWPGLELGNLHRLEEPIQVIDCHAPLELDQVDAALVRLNRVLQEKDLLLDAVVFGLPGESYDSPAIALETVGFAAPGSERRAERFRYARTLFDLVSKRIPRERFVRRRLTVKGHFGGFHNLPDHELRHLGAGLGMLARQALEPHDGLMLAETGCEPASAVIEFINQFGFGRLACNWDTANLALWGAGVDNLEYARSLADAGLLRGVHLKGGRAPTVAGAWGTEIDPGRALIQQVIELLMNCPEVDALIVERELFLGDQRETQEEKAAGLSRTLSLVRDVLAA